MHTGRFVLLAILVCGLFAAAVAAVRGELLILAVPILVYVLAGTRRVPAMMDFEVQRRLSAHRVAADVPVSVTVRLRNLGTFIDQLHIEDLVPAGVKVIDGSTRHVGPMRGGEVFEFSYKVSGQRGRYSFAALDVEARDEAGLFRLRRRLPTEGQLFVLPEIPRLREVAIRPRRTRVYAGQIPARAGGAGLEFFAVRGYQAGDPPRAINWRASARHDGELFSNDFQQERVADVGIVLDGRERSNLFAGRRSIFDHSVLAAAAISEALLQQGNRVGLVVYGKYMDWVLPGYGKLQRERCLQALARAQVGSSSVFTGLDHLSPRMFPPRSQIILVSPLTPEDAGALRVLRARGYHVLVVSPDPVGFEQGLLPSVPEVELAARVARLERRLLIRGLLRAGIGALDWDVTRPFETVAQPAFSRAQVPAAVRSPA